MAVETHINSWLLFFCLCHEKTGTSLLPYQRDTLNILVYLTKAKPWQFRVNINCVWTIIHRASRRMDSRKEENMSKSGFANDVANLMDMQKEGGGVR